MLKSLSFRGLHRTLFDQARYDQNAKNAEEVKGGNISTANAPVAFHNEQNCCHVARLILYLKFEVSEVATGLHDDSSLVRHER